MLIAGILIDVGHGHRLGFGISLCLEHDLGQVVARLTAIDLSLGRLGKSLLGRLVALGHVVGVGRVEQHLIVISVADEAQYVQLHRSLLVASLLNHRERIGQHHVVALLVGQPVGVHLLHLAYHTGIVALSIVAQQRQRPHAVLFRGVGVLSQVPLYHHGCRLRMSVVGDERLQGSYLLLLCMCGCAVHDPAEQLLSHVVATLIVEQFGLLYQPFGVLIAAMCGFHILGLRRECRASQQ